MLHLTVQWMVIGPQSFFCLPPLRRLGIILVGLISVDNWQLTNTFWFQLLAMISFDQNQKFSIKIIRFFFFKSFISTISHFHFHSRWIGWERVPIETTLANVNGSYWHSTWSWTWTPLGESRLHYSSDWLSPHLLRLLLRLWQISDFCCIFLSDISDNLSILSSFRHLLPHLKSLDVPSYSAQSR